MGRRKRLLDKLEYHKRLVESIEKELKILDNIKVNKKIKKIFENPLVIAVKYDKKELLVSNFDSSLQWLKDDGWVVQTSIL